MPPRARPRLDTDGYKRMAAEGGYLLDGKVDLRGRRLAAPQDGLDLREFVLEDMTVATRLTSCVGEGVSFRRSRFVKADVQAAKGEKVSFRGACFDGCDLSDTRFGPRTLDLSGTSWRGATFDDVEFSMPRLVGADFTGAVLRDVTFRHGILHDASFRDATLVCVSFEQAELRGADFTGATFERMDFWGEPDWSGVTIADELRYQFGELPEPARRVDALIARADTPPALREAAERVRERYADLLSYPVCMLIGREMTDAVPAALFPALLKALKQQP